MSPITYRSTDSGAPALTGQTGSLVTLLKTLLYGNGSGIAYGSKASAGWLLPFTNTSTKLVLRNNTANGGSGQYLRVVDDGAISTGFKDAYVQCWAAMSDIDTGTGPYPTSAQQAPVSGIGGMVVSKSSTADGTARTWKMVADDRTAILFIDCNNGAVGAYAKSIYYFGDINSDIASDGYPFALMARTSTQHTNYSYATSGWYVGGGDHTATISAYSGNVLTGSNGSPQTAGSTVFDLYYPRGISSGAGMIGGGSAGTNPMPSTNKTPMIPAYIRCGAGVLRGRLRGIYFPLANLQSLADNATMSATDGLASGSVLELFRLHDNSNGGWTTNVLVETALEW